LEEVGLHFHPSIRWLHYETSFETVTPEAKRGLFAVDSCQQLSNTESEFKIKNWLQEGFASFNVNTTLNQNNVSGFETKTNGYTFSESGQEL
jgi:iron complex outermembrane receptor protein